jgi:hypothetical protein
MFAIIIGVEYCDGAMFRLDSNQTKFTVINIDKKNGTIVVKETISFTPKRKLLKSYIFKDIDVKKINLKINSQIIISNDIYKNSVGKYDRKFKSIDFKINGKKVHYDLVDKNCVEFF